MVYWLKSFRAYRETRYSQCEREYSTTKESGHEQPQHDAKKTWWQNKKIMVGIVIILVAVVTLITAAYNFHWDWTGLSNSHTTIIITEVTQSPQKKVTTTETSQPGKTLWDWLQLLGILAIPVVVGFGTAFFTRQQAKTSEAHAENQQQEELLRTYFDRISELILTKEPSSTQNIESVVRARTLAALHILNAERKAIVLRFLHDAGILQYVKKFLYALDLSNTDLSGIDLSGADLSTTNLNRANLNGATLFFTKLIDAILARANLNGANLFGANLFGANFSRAQLSGILLSSVEQIKVAKDITSEQLEQIISSHLATSQEPKTAQSSTTPVQPEIQPAQTSQEEAEQQTHTQPKQGTDASR